MTLRRIHLISTGIIIAVMVFSIFNFTVFDTYPFPEGGFRHLGFPGYFRWELTIAKILGVLALVVPGVPRRWKEFAYAGFAITLVSAAIAHSARGDYHRSVLFVIDPLAFLGVLAVSYWSWSRQLGGAR